MKNKCRLVLLTIPSTILLPVTGIMPTARVHAHPRPSEAWTGHPEEQSFKGLGRASPLSHHLDLPLMGLRAGESLGTGADGELTAAFGLLWQS